MKRTIWKKLNEWKNKKGRKPLILKGARQVGKTYILHLFGQAHFTNYHYYNFEKEPQIKNIFEKDLKPNRIIQELSIYSNRPIEKDSLIIFDEIQNIPKALTSLKYFHEEIPEQAVCTAGSLLGIHLTPESFPVGNVEFLNLYPMSFEEFLLAQNEIRILDYLNKHSKINNIPDIVHEKLWEQLKIYFILGGLPEVIKTYLEYKGNLLTAIEKTRNLQNNIIKTYLADIAKHAGKQNAMHIERLWQNIPNQLAKEQNGSAPKFTFKNIIPGINRYSKLAGSIDWLEKAGLIIKVPIVNSGELPFKAHSQENIFKLYLFDIGILGALSELPPSVILDYNYGSYKGYFAENFAAQEFLYSGTEHLYCWREGKSEVEFLREFMGQVLPVEIKSGWVTQAKSLKVFANKYQIPYRTIMSAKNKHVDTKNKVYHYPLYLAANFPLEKL
ncbi:ATP-binding protein [Candidatus Margulisiibacteriota bacterium]